MLNKHTSRTLTRIYLYHPENHKYQYSQSTLQSYQNIVNKTEKATTKFSSCRRPSSHSHVESYSSSHVEDQRSPHTFTNTPMNTIPPPSPLIQPSLSPLGGPPTPSFLDITQWETYDWSPSPSLSIDENYLDLCMMLMRTSIALQGFMGCLLVKGEVRALSECFYAIFHALDTFIALTRRFHVTPPASLIHSNFLLLPNPNLFNKHPLLHLLQLRSPRRNKLHLRSRPLQH